MIKDATNVFFSNINIFGKIEVLVEEFKDLGVTSIMLIFFCKFILLFLLCSVAFSLFKVLYYNIGKKFVTKTVDGTKLNWALNVFVKNGTKMDSSDYFIMAVLAALFAIYL